MVGGIAHVLISGVGVSARRMGDFVDVIAVVLLLSGHDENKLKTSEVEDPAHHR